MGGTFSTFGNTGVLYNFSANHGTRAAVLHS
jgi:hypothetical protein